MLYVYFSGVLRNMFACLVVLTAVCVLISWRQDILAVHKDNISIQYNKDYAMGTHIKIKVNDLIKEMEKPGLC
jgi:hypothetical protein